METVGYCCWYQEVESLSLIKMLMACSDIKYFQLSTSSEAVALSMDICTDITITISSMKAVTTGNITSTKLTHHPHTALDDAGTAVELIALRNKRESRSAGQHRPPGPNMSLATRFDCPSPRLNCRNAKNNNRQVERELHRRDRAEKTPEQARASREAVSERGPPVRATRPPATLRDRARRTRHTVTESDLGWVGQRMLDEGTVICRTPKRIRAYTANSPRLTKFSVNTCPGPKVHQSSCYCYVGSSAAALEVIIRRLLAVMLHSQAENIQAHMMPGCIKPVVN
ncbi:hypothetical protein CBL_12430 [Carabus blaptoides fortunei]